MRFMQVLCTYIWYYLWSSFSRRAEHVENQLERSDSG